MKSVSKHIIIYLTFVFVKAAIQTPLQHSVQLSVINYVTPTLQRHMYYNNTPKLASRPYLFINTQHRIPLRPTYIPLNLPQHD